MNKRDFLYGAGACVLLAPLSACVSVGPNAAAQKKSAAAADALALIRREHGLKPLAADRGLETAAARQAGYMASSGLMKHRTGLGRGFVQRMKDVDTGGTAAENVAHGRFDTQKVLSVWMHSPPHRRNMLDDRFSRFGLAAAPDPEDPTRFYWSMVLAS